MQNNKKFIIPLLFALLLIFLIFPLKTVWADQPCDSANKRKNNIETQDTIKTVLYVPSGFAMHGVFSDNNNKSLLFGIANITHLFVPRIDAEYDYGMIQNGAIDSKYTFTSADKYTYIPTFGTVDMKLYASNYYLSIKGHGITSIESTPAQNVTKINSILGTFKAYMPTASLLFEETYNELLYIECSSTGQVDIENVKNGLKIKTNGIITELKAKSIESDKIITKNFIKETEIKFTTNSSEIQFVN